MVECPETKAIWNNICLWWKGITGQEIKLSPRDIIIGKEKGNIKLIMEEQLDIIILATKWNIHKNKQMGQKTHIIQIKREIKQMINTLEYIASRNQKLEKHDDIWRNIVEHLN
jgi:hypothetical protein